MYITINGVQYTAEDILKSTVTAVLINEPSAVDVRDDKDCFQLEGIEDLYLFKTEGKLKIVAKPAGNRPFKKFRLINKHQLKKTHALYSDARPAEVGMLRDHFQRPQRTQGRRW
jgi:hypothetical protein